MPRQISKTKRDRREILLLLQEIIVKKTVVYHIVNGCTVFLHIENSKNDRLKVILLVAV